MKGDISSLVYVYWLAVLHYCAVQFVTALHVDWNLSDLVRSGETMTVFCVFCGRLVNHLRPLTTLSQTKRLSSLHQLSVTVLEDVWKKLFTDLSVAPVAALTRQSVNRHLFNILQMEATSTTSSGQCDSTPVVMGSEEENAVEQPDPRP